MNATTTLVLMAESASTVMDITLVFVLVVIGVNNVRRRQGQQNVRINN